MKYERGFLEYAPGCWCDVSVPFTSRLIDLNGKWRATVQAYLGRYCEDLLFEDFETKDDAQTAILRVIRTIQNARASVAI